MTLSILKTPPMVAIFASVVAHWSHQHYCPLFSVTQSLLWRWRVYSVLSGPHRMWGMVGWVDIQLFILFNNGHSLQKWALKYLLVNQSSHCLKWPTYWTYYWRTEWTHYALAPWLILYFQMAPGQFRETTISLLILKYDWRKLHLTSWFQSLLWGWADQVDQS